MHAHAQEEWRGEVIEVSMQKAAGLLVFWHCLLGHKWAGVARGAA